MKLLYEIKIPTEVGNKKLRDGKMLENIARITESVKPVATYFGITGGKRGIYMIVDVSGPEKIPEIAELYWQNLEAEISVFPILDEEEFKNSAPGIERSLKSIMVTA